MSFENWQKFGPNTPPWIRAGNAGALTGGLGKIKDQLVDRLRAGIMSRFPREDIAADDALGYIGSERLLPRQFGDGSAAYATRLRQAWDTWALAGSHGALLRQLLNVVGGTVHIVQANGWWTKLAKPTPDFTARLLSTADLSSWTLGGGGNTLTNTVNGAAFFDSTFANLNDVIFVPHRTGGPLGMGVYSVTQVGSAGTPTILTRVIGWQNGNSMSFQTSVQVTAGSVLANSRWETLNSFTVGTTAPTFEAGFMHDGVIFGDTNRILSLSRTGWMFDADLGQTFWSRFLLLFPGPGSIGVLATVDGLQMVNAIVDRWKPAYADYVGSVQITSGSAWGWPVDRTWGSWTWGGNTIFLGP